MLKLVFILALSIGCIQYATAVCHKCNERNGVACISENEFHPCFNGVPDTSLKLSCLGENDICTKNVKACMDKTLAVVSPACGDTSNCGKCVEGPQYEGMFACTSRTTFTMCFDGELSDIRITCPENQMCDIAKGKDKDYPCVPSCKESEIEFCDVDHPVDVPVTTTPEPTTTTTEIPTTTTTEIPTTTTTEIPTTTTTEIPTTTTTEIPTTTTEKDTTTTEKDTTTTTEQITTTTEEITTTVIFAPTPPEVITTTTEEPIITTTTQNPAELVCSQQTAAGRYPYPNDKTCKNYIYCFRKGGAMQTTFLKCPAQLYFNPSTSLCGEAKPEGCI